MITLRKIDWDNWEECISLKVTDEQDDFIATNKYSLAQSYVAQLNDEKPPMSFAIYNSERMIGFTLMYHDEAEENEFGDDSCYGICRFMIDQKFQGNGYGRESMKVVLEYLKSEPQGEASSIYLTYDPENKVAQSLYKSFGFIETGEISEGEIVAKLAL
jgi:diamine N-acetyltransferase